ncbi:hypothetical protein [Halobacillus sp. A5]|uniref:hypothetical protein n=1 Tax=Halobacillus sp. A5 TaxID=2880263 RepID=UPI0020A66909|nr:hypothetical protein [Halobacillus sp. A5]MCP3027985.1 hypothetical protein [Halobacillus sp. A5]
MRKWVLCLLVSLSLVWTFSTGDTATAKRDPGDGGIGSIVELLSNDPGDGGIG